MPQFPILKPVEFRGGSLDALREFPVESRRAAGVEIDRVQRGLTPADWKPMASVGRGAKEIRIKDANGAFRVVYVAQIGDAVYVLHCFRKTTEKTPLRDIRLAKKRYDDLVKELKS